MRSSCRGIDVVQNTQTFTVLDNVLAIGVELQKALRRQQDRGHCVQHLGCLIEPHRVQRTEHGATHAVQIAASQPIDTEIAAENVVTTNAR